MVSMPWAVHAVGEERNSNSQYKVSKMESTSYLVLHGDGQGKIPVSMKKKNWRHSCIYFNNARKRGARKNEYREVARRGWKLVYTTSKELKKEARVICKEVEEQTFPISFSLSLSPSKTNHHAQPQQPLLLKLSLLLSFNFCMVDSYKTFWILLTMALPGNNSR